MGVNMQQKYMTEAEKGYKCPDGDCFNCEFRKTKCIVYSKEGQKNYKKWLKNQQRKR
ncbi:MAG: hypothetical protein Q4B64_07520 [Spirochaetales bacterium]|nr:hypothetical protein [Spirochaetales bacterium]